jgi:hypothetical protein
LDFATSHATLTRGACSREDSFPAKTIKRDISKVQQEPLYVLVDIFVCFTVSFPAIALLNWIFANNPQIEFIL